ncbi:MAG: hypothetical protein Q9184_006022 [Pyrenodesmia sp. 2 TL-2023]
MLENIRSLKAGRLLDLMRSRFQHMGNTYSATVAGNLMIFTVEPENIKAIFADRFHDFDAGWIRRRALAPAVGDVLITADGARWHQQRAMLRPAFNKQKFSEFAFYQRDIDELISKIPSDGSTIDLAPLFSNHALALASKLLFGESIADLNPEFAAPSNRFVEAFKQGNKGSDLRMRMGRLLPLLPRDRSYEANCRTLHEYSDLFVQKALAYRNSWKADKINGENGAHDRYIFLQELVKELDDPEQLRNQLLGMLLVGSETTASLLTGCLSLLSNRPNLWTNLREAAIELGQPSSEGMRSFTALVHFINEVLRLYPVLPIYGRMANKDTFLPIGGGPRCTSRVFVPRGTQVMVDTHALHRRPDIFGDDSDEFRPERWNSGKPPGHWNYLPFSGGPRVCIGRSFSRRLKQKRLVLRCQDARRYALEKYGSFPNDVAEAVEKGLL